MGIPLRTERLWLVPLDSAADAADVHVAFADPEVMMYWDEPPSRDVGETAGRLAGAVGDYWTVRDVDGGPVLGLIGIMGGVDIPGLQWILRRDVWGRGYAGEAAIAFVEYALGELGLERVEAWVDIANGRSIAVARRAGLTERGRLPQRYPHRDRPHETVVMGRARLAEPTVVLNVVVELPVRDVSGTSGLFENVFGCTVLFTEDDFAGLGIGAWSGGRRIHLVTDERPSPVRLSLETVTEFDAIHARAVAAGVQIGQYPVVQPWGRREFVIALPDGHEVTVSGPL